MTKRRHRESDAERQHHIALQRPSTSRGRHAVAELAREDTSAGITLGWPRGIAIDVFCRPPSWACAARAHQRRPL
jgi:hypothetical protein